MMAFENFETVKCWKGYKLMKCGKKGIMGGGGGNPKMAKYKNIWHGESGHQVYRY
jgi:hypothetical protein